MPTVDVMDKTRKAVDKVDLPDDIFNIEVQSDVLHQIVRWQLAKRRAGSASTKTRSEVRGGGRKPWRQKGTGRARVGTIRSPLWRGGGITHGPRPRDYSYKLNKKLKALGLKMALSAKLQAEQLMVISDLDFGEIKTKLFASMMKELELTKTLFVVEGESREAFLSSRNIPGVKLIRPEGLNVYDVLKYDQLVLVKPSVEKILERLS